MLPTLSNTIAATNSYLKPVHSQRWTPHGTKCLTPPLSELEHALQQPKVHRSIYWVASSAALGQVVILKKPPGWWLSHPSEEYESQLG